ncbi:hypothetical protein WICPIJ_007524 [Wickerhamomyces pijperi]|uniref:Uncharacterized protein n=1 Tax=Wickerhamomyces pijperi TaxID=599730 RepID=A0A9P8TKC2_WICPI|nr:hypothetical protein WICPIJ_007524 [Wickerhamomyces pijperi]
MGILWFGSSWEREVDNNRFDLIDVDQFKNYRVKTLFNYLVLWCLLILKTVLFGVDIYTCVKLLAFNEWTSEVTPFLSFKISKWLFAGCIIASVVFVIYDASKGIKIFASKNISLTYTNSFARILRSITSYKKFCLLNEINPSSGFDKIAFFTYFQIIGCKRLLVADSPRQVINALTLYSVLHVRSGFISAIKEISTTSKNEAVILYSMTISFFIWIFFISEFAVACVFTIPVYYDVLHVQRFQTLRQYVCIQVNNTVRKLARGHQKKNLEKLAKENMKKNYHPRLPDIEPITPGTGFVPKPYRLRSNNSTFDSSNEKPPVISKTTTFDSERNPFTDRHQIRKPPSQHSIALSQPAQVYQSKTSLASHFVEPKSFYQTQHNFSSGSVDSLVFGGNNSTVEDFSYPERFDSRANLLQHRPSTAKLSAERTGSFPERFDSLKDRSSSDTTSEKTKSNSPYMSPVFPYDQDKSKERKWIEEESGTHNDPFESLSDFEGEEEEEEEEVDDFDTSMHYHQSYPEESHADRMKRVRESLVTRVREMQDEDYSRFKPDSPIIPVQTYNQKSKKKIKQKR